MSVAYPFEHDAEVVELTPYEARARRQEQARADFDRNHGARIREAAKTAMSVNALADDLRLPRHQVRAWMAKHNVAVQRAEPRRAVPPLSNMYSSFHLLVDEPTGRLFSDQELVAAVARWLNTAPADITPGGWHAWRNHPSHETVLPGARLLEIRLGSFANAVALARQFNDLVAAGQMNRDDVFVCPDYPSLEDHRARVTPLLERFIADEEASGLTPRYDRFKMWMASIGEPGGDYRPGFASWERAMRAATPSGPRRLGRNP